jgi:hypothetical protein
LKAGSGNSFIRSCWVREIAVQTTQHNASKSASTTMAKSDFSLPIELFARRSCVLGMLHEIIAPDKQGWFPQTDLQKYYAER